MIERRLPESAFVQRRCSKLDTRLVPYWPACIASEEESLYNVQNDRVSRGDTRFASKLQSMPLFIVEFEISEVSDVLGRSEVFRISPGEGLW